MLNQTNSMKLIRHKLTRPLLWTAVFILAAIGVAVTINRVLILRDGVAFLDPLRATVSKTALQDLETFDRGFVKFPMLTYLHIVPGSLFLILVPLQFSSRFRNRYISFHRWSGRLIVLIGILAGLFGLLLAAPFQFTGIAATSAVIVFGSLFLFALIRAFIAIRRRDVARHREWMIRAFSIGIGISTVRIVAGVMALLKVPPSFDLLGLSFWIGWTITFAAGELWIRNTSRVFR